MDEEALEKEIRKAKRFNCIVFAILVIIVAAVAGGLIVRHISRTFTTEKWLNDPENRTRIVDDLLSRHSLAGLSEEEITALLGEKHDYSSPDRYVYYLGPERGLISIDSEWLIIEFDGSAVSNFFITTD